MSSSFMHFKHFCKSDFLFIVIFYYTVNLSKSFEKSHNAEHTEPFLHAIPSNPLDCSLWGILIQSGMSSPFLPLDTGMHTVMHANTHTHTQYEKSRKVPFCGSLFSLTSLEEPSMSLHFIFSS